jgi:hypothetical protein
MWAWVFGVGIGLEVVGLLVTGRGIWTTWRANAQGELMTAPVVNVAKRVGWWLNDRLPPRLRRGRVRQLEVHDSLTISESSTVGLATGWSPLSPDLTIEEALAELDTRISQVAATHQAADHAIHQRLEELGRHDGELGTRIDQVEAQVQETARLLRVEGLRVQAVGVGLIAVGLMLQTVGQVGI